MLTRQFHDTVDPKTQSTSGGSHTILVIREGCPRCKSTTYKKNDHIHNGTQHPLCHDCGRQVVDCFAPYLIPDDTRALLARLLRERLS